MNCTNKRINMVGGVEINVRPPAKIGIRYSTDSYTTTHFSLDPVEFLREYLLGQHADCCNVALVLSSSFEQEEEEVIPLNQILSIEDIEAPEAPEESISHLAWKPFSAAKKKKERAFPLISSHMAGCKHKKGHFGGCTVDVFTLVLDLALDKDDLLAIILPLLGRALDENLMVAFNRIRFACNLDKEELASHLHRRAELNRALCAAQTKIEATKRLVSL